MHRIVFAAHHKGRALDAMEVGEHVEGVALAARSGEPLRHLRPVEGAARHIRIAWGSEVKRHRQLPPRVARGLVRMAVKLQEAAARQRAYFRAAKALEQFHAPVWV